MSTALPSAAAQQPTPLAGAPVHEDFPAVDLIFARSSLLAARVPAEALGQPLGLNDAELTTKLATGKGRKIALRLAPLFAHQALHDGRFPLSEELAETLSRMEQLLQAEADNPWFALTAQAAHNNCGLTSWYKGVALDQKRLLLKHSKSWQATAKRVQGIMAEFMLDEREPIRFYAAGAGAGSAQVSLKKLSKFTPRAE